MMDTNMKCKNVGMEEGIIPIKFSKAGGRREIFQKQYPLWNCSWPRWKWKIISVMNTNIKCNNADMDEGRRPIKYLPAWWTRETFQTQCPMWNYSWLPWKWKTTSAMDTSIKCKKARTKEGIMPLYKIYENTTSELSKK